MLVLYSNERSVLFSVDADFCDHIRAVKILARSTNSTLFPWPEFKKAQKRLLKQGSEFVIKVTHSFHRVFSFGDEEP